MKLRRWLRFSAMLLGACLAAAAAREDAAGVEVHAMIEGMHTALLEGKPEKILDRIVEGGAAGH